MDSPLGKGIQLGCNLFEYMIQNKMDAIEFDSYGLLPSTIIGNNDLITIEDLFSKYKK